MDHQNFWGWAPGISKPSSSAKVEAPWLRGQEMSYAPSPEPAQRPRKQPVGQELGRSAKGPWGYLGHPWGERLFPSEGCASGCAWWLPQDMFSESRPRLGWFRGCLGRLGGCQEGTPHGACHRSLSLDPSGLFLTPGYSEFEGLMEGWGWGVNEEKDVTTRCQ